MILTCQPSGHLKRLTSSPSISLMLPSARLIRLNRRRKTPPQSPWLCWGPAKVEKRERKVYHLRSVRLLLRKQPKHGGAKNGRANSEQSRDRPKRRSFLS